MVFTSLPAYLDPSNWQQQPNNNQLLTGASSGAITHLLPPPPPPPPPPPQPHGSGGGAGSIRPASMADRARLANIPMPEAAQKCPRCESTNTKFCYFNNYSLTQPRHFCKTCRRYWTRGGALRNVPVGGGCRRNKRTKGNKSSSPVTGDRSMGSSSSGTVSSNSGTSHDYHHLLGIGPVPLPPPPLRFMSPLHHHLTEISGGGDNLGLNYAALAGTHHDLNFQVGNALVSAGLGGIVGGGGGGASLLSMTGGGAGLEQQWRQQFSFMGHGFDSSSPSSSTHGLYPFEVGGVDPSSYGQARPKSISTNSVATQFASVKMEDNQELALSRQFSSIVNPGNDNQYWGGAASALANSTAWTDLSSFSSSSTSNPL